MKSILRLLLVFANMGFTVAGEDKQPPQFPVPSHFNSQYQQDGFIVLSPDHCQVLMN